MGGPPCGDLLRIVRGRLFWQAGIRILQPARRLHLSASDPRKSGLVGPVCLVGFLARIADMDLALLEAFLALLLVFLMAGVPWADQVAEALSDRIRNRSQWFRRRIS